MSVRDDLDFVGNMVKHKQGICQHQYRLGESLGVLIGAGQFLKVTGNLVAQVANHATMESGKAGNGHGTKLSELLFHQIQWVNGIIISCP